MKTLLPMIFVLTTLAAPGEGEEVAHRAKILKLEGKVQQTPEYQVAGPGKKPSKARDWIEIEAEIEVETTDPRGFIAELEAQWFAVIVDRQSKPDKKPVRLLGKATFKNIRTADRKIFLSAYIDPDTLERLTGGSRLSEGDIEGYALTLAGPGVVKEGKYAEGLSKATAEKAAKWWVTWPGENLEGGILAKSKTPFAPLWTDRYPTEKTAD